MRKVVVSVLVIVLAGSCWVVAQNASSSKWASPYGQQAVPPLTVVPPPAKAVEKTDMPMLQGDTVVAPTTDLDLPMIPVPPVVVLPAPTPVPAKMPEVALPTPAAETNLIQIPIVDVPTTVKAPEKMVPVVETPKMIPIIESPPRPEPVSADPPAATERMIPVIDPPAPKAIASPNYPVMDTNPNVPSAPITMPAMPIGTIPPVAAKPMNRSVVKSASPIIPGLPPVPGVNADYTGMPPAMPAYQTPAVVMQGPATIPVPLPQTTPVPMPVPQGTSFQQPPVVMQGPATIPVPMPQPTPVPMPVPQGTSYSVDAPSMQPTGEGVFNGPQVVIEERILGPRLWASADYLMWFIKPANLPPLVRGINGVQPGDTGFEAAQVAELFPGDENEGTLNSGVRGTFGFWLNRSQTIGFEGSYFWLGDPNQKDTFRSTPGMIIGRPFIDSTNGESLLFQLSSIDGTNGSVRISQHFQAQGGEANFLLNSFGMGQRLNVLAGFRYFETNERLRIASMSINEATGFTGQTLDSFSMVNRFYGGQVGLRWSYEGRRVFANITGKFAYGGMQERVHINGATLINNTGTVLQAPGGVLALPANIGSYTRSQAAFIPEANATIGYNFTPWASAFVGYNFMYVSNLARPGQQINVAVDPRDLPFGPGGGSSPAFVFKDESFWLQGINFGVSFRY